MKQTNMKGVQVNRRSNAFTCSVDKNKVLFTTIDMTINKKIIYFNVSFQYGQLCYKFLKHDYFQR